MFLTSDYILFKEAKQSTKQCSKLLLTHEFVLQNLTHFPFFNPLHPAFPVYLQIVVQLSTTIRAFE